jgi:hypothetical protein
MSDAHARTGGPDFPGAVTVTIELEDDGVLRIKSTPSDDDTLIAVLKIALFAVTKVDPDQFLQ